MRIILFEPEIPPNTGNIARLCAATSTELHLIEPLGFKLEDKYLKRAGLDYWQYVKVFVWASWSNYLNRSEKIAGERLICTSSKKANNSIPVHKFNFLAEDSLVFGPETRGLPQEILQSSPYRVRIPMQENIRSINLSTCAGIVLYMALSKAGILDTWQY